MKKNVTLFVFAIIASMTLFLGSASGPANNFGLGVTGAPFDFGTCGNIGCHGGGSYGPIAELLTVREKVSGTIVSEYQPGTVYELEVTISAGSIPFGYGFQLTVADGAGTYPGGLAAPNFGTQISSLSGREYAEHSSISASNTFTVDWTAPAAGAGDMTFYFTGNAINFDFGPGGDNAGPGGSLVLPESQPACNIQSATPVGQTACTVGTSTYSQFIEITYVDEPATGNLNVNGQIFPISGSPQQVELTGLVADCSTNLIIAFFTDDPTCGFTGSFFTAPPSCNVSQGGPVSLVDGMVGGAVNDGTIGTMEYSNFSEGINGGFGDVIGEGSKIYIESDNTGNVQMGISTGPGALSDAAVIYIESDPFGTPSGFNSTAMLNDQADGGRSAISAVNADLTFPGDFFADYAIVVEPGFAGIFELAAGGDNSLTFIASANLTPTGNPNAGDFEIDFDLGPLGMNPGDCFAYIITYLNGSNGFRSNEFHGVTNNCVLSGGNIGQVSSTLDIGNGNLFCTETILNLIRINELRTNQPGADDDEYFELRGPAGTNLTGLTYLVIGDNLSGGSGVIESVTDLSGQVMPGSGLFVVAESGFTLGTADFTTTINFENTDNVTHLIVTNFTGTNDQDLDVNEDGILEITPWDAVIDAVSLKNEDFPAENYAYAASLGFPEIGPELVPPASMFHPAHLYYCQSDWQIGPFDDASGRDTPGLPNDCCSDNMILVGQTTTASVTNTCEEYQFTYYEDPNNTGNYFFAINWDPNGTGANAAAKAAATVTVTTGNPGVAESIPQTKATYTMERYWDINLNGTSLESPIEVKFYYDMAERTTIVNAAQNFATTYATGYEGFAWFKIIDAPFDPNIHITAEEVINEIELFDNNSMSRMENGVLFAEFSNIESLSGGTGATGAGATNTPLPIELAEFSGFVVREGNVLNWTTLTEINSMRFEIESSTDGQNYTKIGVVEASGDSQSPQSYEFLDTRPAALTYYRLKMIDKTGLAEWSNVIVLKREQITQIEVFPNPAKNQVNIIMESSLDQELIQLTLTDVSGRVMLNTQERLGTGVNQLHVNTSELANGMYILTINGESRNFIQKILIGQ